MLVDLEPLSPGGENGGIKPSLRELFRYLGAQKEQPFEFVYLSRAHLSQEVQREWMRPSDQHRLVEESAPDIALTEGCDLVFASFGMTRWACAGIPTVLLVVDTLHRDFPESISGEECRYREECFRAATTQVDLFHVISDYTGKRLSQHYGISPEAIVRTHLAIHRRLISGSVAPPNPQSSRSPYFFYPANAWAHKNHKTLLVAYALYRHEARQAGEPVWRLVFTGNDDAAMQEVQALVRTLSLAEHVEFRGYVDEATLAQIWAGADALVFPSLHEGFGIPLLEAMEHGVPILANNATAIPEVAGDAAHLVDARSPERLANAMRQISNDDALRTALVERGRARLAEFSLTKELGCLIPAFRALLGRPTKLKHCGYYEDQLTAPLATFALPQSTGDEDSATLHYETDPLGQSRTVEVCADSQLLSTLDIPATAPCSGQIALPTAARTLSLRTTNAARVSKADPRVLGIRPIKLEVHHSPSGRISNLLPPLPVPSNA